MIQYKDVQPSQTISNIKSILSKYDIHIRETLFNMGELFHSCRVEIDNCGLDSLGIGTNGKGMSKEYSLASGYAELLERLQNKFLVNEAMRHSDKIPDGKQLPFRFFPDEKLQQCSLRDFICHIHDLFPNYSTYKSDYDSNSQVEWLGLPYACLFKNESYLVNVPIVLARANSSTGMCAGNTPHEAILQGINEIFERYVLQKIYLERITPPSFPSSYFIGTKIAKRLDELSSQGYIYDIKDMSLGKGFPVVGLILTNTINGTTMFRMGADLSAEIALERCLTETYQGRNNLELKFTEYAFPSVLKIDEDKELRGREYKKNLRDGTGIYPNYIFCGTPTYEFTEPVMSRSGNTKKDLQNVFEFLFERDYKILIRDNSFLGFCAYHVMIPGLSDQDFRLVDIFSDYISNFEYNRKDEKCISFERDAKQWALYDIKSETDARKFIRQKYADLDTIKLAPYCTDPRNQVNKDLLLFLFAVKNEDYKDADTCFTNLMNLRKEQGIPYDEYMACISAYISLKANDVKDAELVEWLAHFYSMEIIKEVITDFSAPKDIMKNYSFPVCFDCNNCPLGVDCHYRDAISFEEKIQKVQMENPIDQKQLFKLY